MNIPFLKYSKIYYIFSGLLTMAAISALFVFGLRFGIDFTGGSILEVEFEQRPENAAIQEKLKNLNLGEITIQPTGEKGVILRLKNIEEPIHQEILKNLGVLSGVKELRFENIGPVIGKELRQKTIILIIISLAALFIYIAISFRKVTFPFSSWQFGIVSIIGLFFDVLIPISVFALLGKLYNIQFNIPIITALLTILGYTINDKVIVFDRVRENISRIRGIDFNTLVNQSLNEILFRSLSTGTCSLLVLFFIFLLGGETLKYFALTLMIGITVGTYSSLFLASPLLVSWLQRRQKRG
ncbi:MAG: protein translocase subunit SecF [Candidatus Nealsonbacteria bacterium CG_4_9_14_0_2_um_filter_37_38]|uniref:Protein-export membrane protein SecF n=1 Tax=Candidatus Nealsonbacteria bacterium CG_4_10_14_0_8_um_filter_37_14 TaxID=1974684 RepID=A0A2M7R7Q1_9BACT|nr:MAG: protein translocase subunit SecF [Candidatus Nealsonbacteria bacterium CG11_big_fil_rev_8_21_14_0_20_37_68]PIW91819.1 MAG: protein translocase subunit SecF [Candidatus Nealsonbacteria bacterium CG_4_8_14_3_um_filter_37_23]PIY89486.1 MAG: protein translocase subunit SecF [Candidatus Nealsonbacteria bacterium CG_4_10_14_0_8_um_filter_37_14]PJC51516.1 MAG: protein translocase subunit SecF [Candidatus Nealsonbacteria bacterium CG_4_9_14_0_2_um_filter_37_38]